MWGYDGRNDLLSESVSDAVRVLTAESFEDLKTKSSGQPLRVLTARYGRQQSRVDVVVRATRVEPTTDSTLFISEP